MKRIVLILLACVIAGCSSKEKEMGREPSQVTGGVSKAESMALTAQELKEETREERRDRRKEERRQESAQVVTENFYGEIQKKCQGPASEDKAFTLKVLKSLVFYAYYTAAGARYDIEEEFLNSKSIAMARASGLEYVDMKTGESHLKPICSYSIKNLQRFIDEVSSVLTFGTKFFFYDKIRKEGIRY